MLDSEHASPENRKSGDGNRTNGEWESTATASAGTLTEKLMKTSKSALSEKAIELFREKGYENVSVGMICKACGVTSGSFYHHFSSKEELLSHYLNAEVAHHFDLTILEIVDITDPKERLWTVLEDITQYWLMFGNHLGKQLWTSIVNNKISLFFDTDEFKPVDALVMRFIETCIAEGVVARTDDALLIRRMLYSIVIGLSIQWATFEDFDFLTEFRKQYDALMS